MTEPSAAQRVFISTAFLGGTLAVAAWGFALYGARGENFASVVLVVSALFALCMALAVSLSVSRRSRDLEALAERIRWLGETENMTPIVHPAERAPHMDVLFRHITDAQDSIQRRISKLENDRRRGFHVLGHMTDGVLAISSERRVLLLNPAARRLLGLTRESLLGRRLAEVVRVPQIITAADNVLAGNGPEEIEFDLPSDHERHLRLQAIELPADGAAGVLITIRDESQVRKLEKLRREFIANVSHELKTPLAAVKAYAETLQLGAKEDPETCTHFLNQIDFQANRLERLINDMLQLARAQTGTENLVLTVVPLAPVLKESLTTYEPLARARDISIDFQALTQPAAVVADREALVTIINNLLGNAVRYTPVGGHVEVRCREVGKFWAIMVSDNGPGIPEADQERVFERFYRVEKARDSTKGGTGLGLSIVKNLVQAFQGEVRLQSKFGHGATFEVRLPTAVTD